METKSLKYNLKKISFSDPESWAKLKEHLDLNGRPGLQSPFEVLNKHYTHKANGCTDWSGFPASGKTYFVLEYFLAQSERNGLRHGLYLPDLGTYYEVMEKLVKMYTGKDFTDKYYNKITESELHNARAFIEHHFIILVKENVRASLSPEQFWEYICDYKDDFGGLHTGLIDSWKNVTQEASERSRDLYLDRVLSYRNELAETYKKHFHTIAHPAKTEMEVNDGKKKRRVPTAQDMKGGEAWNANGKNIIIIDRPDRESPMIDIFVEKTKPENVGVQGSIIAMIGLDAKRGRYFENRLGGKGYAWDWIDNPVHENLTRKEQIQSAQEGIRAAKQETEVKDFWNTKDNPFQA